jgi:hypothetical protein
MKKHVLLVLLGAWATGALSQSFSLTADTAQISIGEQVQLELSATLPGPSEILWPVLPDTISGLTLVKTGPLDTLPSKQGLRLNQKITITSFDSGFVVIPPLRLLQNGTSLAQSQRLIIEVFMPEVKEEQAAYDIKKPLSVEKPLWETLKWVLLALLLLLALGLAIWYLRKTKKPQSAAAMRRTVSPHETALAELKALEKKQLWQQNKLKAYFSELVDILRVYLEHAYALKALESTAAELSIKIERLPLSGELKSELAQMLRTSALVKYAKEKTTPNENTRALDLVRQLVQETLKKEEAHV